MQSAFASEEFLYFSRGSWPASVVAEGVTSGAEYSEMPYLVMTKKNALFPDNAHPFLVTPICLSGPQHFNVAHALTELMESFGSRSIVGGFIQTRDLMPVSERTIDIGRFLVCVDSRTNYRLELEADIDLWLNMMKRDSRYRCRGILDRRSEFFAYISPKSDSEKVRWFAGLYASMASRLKFAESYCFSVDQWEVLFSSSLWDLVILEYQGRPVAGAAIAKLDGGYDYTFMAVEPSEQDLARAMILFCFELLRDSEGQFLDLGGGISEDDSLARFKRSMGGQAVLFKRLKFLDSSKVVATGDECRTALEKRWP